MSKLTEAEVLTRGAGRDLNAELLEAVADMQAFEKNLVITDGESSASTSMNSVGAADRLREGTKDRPPGPGHH